VLIGAEQAIGPYLRKREPAVFEVSAHIAPGEKGLTTSVYMRPPSTKTQHPTPIELSGIAAI
jgi:hypothetical protein